MRVVLVQPHIPGLDGWSPPLGLLSLATVLRNGGVEVSVVDLSDGIATVDDVDRALSGAAPVVLGVTCTLANRREALSLAERAPGWVVFGGPQATIGPEEFLGHSRCLVVRGEGEAVIGPLVRALASGGSALDVPGVCCTAGGKKVIRPPAPRLEDFAGLPIPDRSFVQMSRYRLRIDGRPATTAMTSRGCTHRCTFCYNRSYESAYRARRAVDVVEEIETLASEYGFEAINFYDDDFAHRLDRTAEFCRLMRRRAVPVRWRCWARVGSLDARMLELMREGGCVSVVFGAESGSSRTLRRLKKGITVPQILATARACRSASLHARFSLVIGFPWEDEAEIRSTLDLIEEVAPSSASVSLFTPFPGTPLYDEIIASGNSVDLDRDITHLATPTFELERLDRGTLLRLLDEGRRRASARPDVIELAQAAIA